MTFFQVLTFTLLGGIIFGVFYLISWGFVRICDKYEFYVQDVLGVIFTVIGSCLAFFLAGLLIFGLMLGWLK